MCCLIITKILTLSCAFPTGAFLAWASLHRNTDVNLMEQTPCARKREKKMAENFSVLGFVSWRVPNFLGILLSWYRRTGIWSVSVRMPLLADATTIRVVSWESVHAHGLAAGSSHSNINQLDIWSQTEATHLTATDAFTFQLSAKRLFSLGCQVYTT